MLKCFLVSAFWPTKIYHPCSSAIIFNILSVKLYVRSNLDSRHTVQKCYSSPRWFKVSLNSTVSSVMMPGWHLLCRDCFVILFSTYSNLIKSPSLKYAFEQRGIILGKMNSKAVFSEFTCFNEQKSLC